MMPVTAVEDEPAGELMSIFGVDNGGTFTDLVVHSDGVIIPQE
jgi:hypothetical protein